MAALLGVIAALALTDAGAQTCTGDVLVDLTPSALPILYQINMTGGMSTLTDQFPSASCGAPNPMCVVGAPGSTMGRDVIIQYTAPCNSTYTITADVQGGFDSVLEVRRDDPCSGALIACNDDYTGLPALFACSNSRVVTPLSIGVTYYFIITGKANGEGFLFFSLSSTGCTPGGCTLGESLAENPAVSIKTNGSVIPTQTIPYENEFESFTGLTSAGNPVVPIPQDFKWELGVPVAAKGVTADHTRGGGTKCLATDLDAGIKEFRGRMTAITPWIAVPPLATMANPSASFWFVHNSVPSGRATTVLSTVQVERMGAPTPQSIHPNRNNFSQFPSTVYAPISLCSTSDTAAGPAGWWNNHSTDEDPTNENGWAFCTLDLTAFAGQTVRLRYSYWNFGYEAGCPSTGCPSPGMLVDDLKVGYNVVINEIYTGDGTPGNPSWIEIYNNGPTRVNTSGWSLEVNDGTSTTVAVLPINSLRTYHGMVIAEGSNPTTVAVNWTHIWGQLSTNLSHTTGGAITLRDPLGSPVDFVRWGGNLTPAPVGLLWAGSVGNPASATDTLARSRLAADTGRAEDWEPNFGRDSIIPTPGWDNDSTLPVEVVSVSLKKAQVGNSFIDELRAVGGRPPYTWALTAPQPMGWMWPSTTPSVSMGPATPTGVVSTGASVVSLGQEGLFRVRVTVTDSLGATDNQDLVLTIGPLSPSNMLHTINTPSSLTWQFTDNSTTESGFNIHEGVGPSAGAVVLDGIGPSCPQDMSGYGTTTGSIVPTPPCQPATATVETGLLENTKYTRSAHAKHALPSIIQGVTINEFDLGQNDMVELYNYSTTDTDISGWVLELNQRVSASCPGGLRYEFYTFPAGTILRSGRTLRVYDNGIIAEDTDTIKNKGSNWNPTNTSIMNIVLRTGGSCGSATIKDYVEINGDYTCRPSGCPAPPAFASFANTNSRNKAQRIIDLDNNAGSDWRSEAIQGTPGSLNPGQAGIVIFDAESSLATFSPPVANMHAAYTSVDAPVLADINFGAISDTTIEVLITQPPNATTANTGIQVEYFLDSDGDGVLDGGETVFPMTAWMSVAEGGGYLDETNWSNDYNWVHTGLTPATYYCYRFRYRNGDGDPMGPGDITAWSPWNCALTSSSCAYGTFVCGDCNGNGWVEITDALQMAQIDVDLAPAPAYGTWRYNVCNIQGPPVPLVGARITILDALKAANYVVGRTLINCCTP